MWMGLIIGLPMGAAIGFVLAGLLFQSINSDKIATCSNAWFDEVTRLNENLRVAEVQYSRLRKEVEDSIEADIERAEEREFR
jgi:hypothetical protein